MHLQSYVAKCLAKFSVMLFTLLQKDEEGDILDNRPRKPIERKLSWNNPHVYVFI